MSAAAGAIGAAKRRGVAGCWLGVLAGPRLPPLRNLFLQIEDPEFHIREPLIIFLGKSFESLVHYHHP